MYKSRVKLIWLRKLLKPLWIKLLKLLSIKLLKLLWRSGLNFSVCNKSEVYAILKQFVIIKY